MRPRLLGIVFAAFLAGGSAPAAGWLLYPDGDASGRLIVEIDRATGEAVRLADLPAPFNTALQTEQGPDALSFRWSYDRQAQGLAFLKVSPDGKGVFEFRFAATEPIAWRWLGATAVLQAADGSALHSFYARAELKREMFERGAYRHSVRLPLTRPPEWWRQVEAIGFFRMTYHPMQELDGEGVWAAMRNAVRRVTKGAGGEVQG